MVTLETESMFADWLDQARQLGGWTATHFRPARSAGGYVTAITGDKGFPDWTLVHPDGRLIFAELKGARGQVTPEQRSWLDLLAHSAVTETPARTLFSFDVCLWRPDDKPEIEAVLVRGQRPSSTRWAISRSHAQPDQLPMEATP